MKNNQKARKDASLYKLPDKARKLMDYLYSQRKHSKDRQSSQSKRKASPTLLPCLKQTCDASGNKHMGEEALQSRKSKAIARKRLQIFFAGV
jgi:hypothetical protein